MQSPIRQVLAALVLAAFADTAVAGKGPSWLPPVDMNTGSLAQSVYDVVVFDPFGTAFVQYIESPSSKTRFKIRPTGGAFGDEQTLPLLPNNTQPDSFAPYDLAFDPTGIGLFMWNAGSFGRTAARSPGVGGTFGPFHTVGDETRVVVNPSGLALAVWVQGKDVKAAFRAPGADTTFDVANAQTLSTATSSASLAYPILDPDGAAAAIWQEDATIRQATKSAGSSTWNPAVDVAPGGAGRLHAAMGPNGHAAAVWTGATGSSFAPHRGVLRVPGGAFGSPSDISPASHFNTSSVVAVDADGAVAVGWEASNSLSGCMPGQSVVGTTFGSATLGGGFGAPIPVSSGSGLATEQSIAIGGGNVVFAYERIRNDGQGVCDLMAGREVVAHVGPVGDIGIGHVVSAPPTVRAQSPRVGVHSNGTAVAAWERADGLVQAAVYEDANATTTTFTTSSSTTTSTTLACTTPRCLLDAALETGACADEDVPAPILRKLDKALAAIDAAAGQSEKKARKALKRARRLLKAAAKASARSARGRRPKLTAECASAIATAATAASNSLP